METLMSGSLLPDRLAWAQVPDKDNWPRVVGGPALYAAMEVSLRQRGARQVPHSVSFKHHVERMLGGHVMFTGSKGYTNLLIGEIGVPQAWTLLSDRQLSYLNMPTLSECRAGFDKYMGQKTTWPADDGVSARNDGEERPGY